MLDNFLFVKQFDKELYERIHTAEKKLKTDYDAAGSYLRKKVIEYFMNSIIKKHNLQTALENYCSSCTPAIDSSTLHSKMRFLTNRWAIRNLNNPRIRPLVCMSKTKNGFAEYKVSAKYINMDGQEVYRKIEPDEEEIDAFVFLRWAGNACSHDDEEIVKPKVHLTYENILEAFRVTYHIFACYFNDTARYGKYREERIPFEDFDVEQAFVPNDSLRTGCIMEYEAQNKSDEHPVWAIIREYKKSEIDKNFFLRGYDTTMFTKHQLIDVPDAMIEVKNLTQFDNEVSPYYTIAYTFSRKPQKLSDTIKQISLKSRYEMCLRIAKCFEELHTNQKPIFHRLLNHNCIYTLDCKDVGRDWVASVLKFDFSKIPDKGEAYTVFANVSDAKDKITNESEKKYIAPEWTEENRDANWEKVDIFSLGMLFCDILSGEILPDADSTYTAFQKMPVLGIDEELVEIIFNMTAEIIQDRPAISEVVEALKKHRI